MALVISADEIKVKSSYTPGQKLQFTQVEFDNRQKLIDYLNSKQLTENDIIDSIKE